MNVTANIFGARVAFIFEKRSRPYVKYGDASIAREKIATAQKTLRWEQLSCSAGRTGV